jgi:glutamine amidotransferase
MTSSERSQTVAIVDFGAGNLFSVVQACKKVGLTGVVTDDPRQLALADAVLLPGVGAFGRAMDRLKERGLAGELKSYARCGKPLVGICLGMQLLMSASEEFGHHEGLGLFNGNVRKLPGGSKDDRLKVPNIGWRPIYPAGACRWENTLLEDVSAGSFLYLIHSYYVEPEDGSISLAETCFGEFRYCAALNKDNIWGFQFHPEKSANVGLSIYRALANRLGVAA